MKRLSAMTAGARIGMCVLLAHLAAVGTGLTEPVEMPASSMPWGPSLPAGQLNVGLHFGDQQVESYSDILIPVWQQRLDLIFVNPRGTGNDDDSQECNFGLGWRHLFPGPEIMIGGNLFYDRRNTPLDNTFNQAGFGVEFLSQWVDARANFYLPENGEKTKDDYVVTPGTLQEHNEYWSAPTAQGHVISQYGYEITDSYNLKNLQHYRTTEQAMDGFDAEIGSLLPLPVLMDYADIKAFVGFYEYNAHYDDRISGVKGRIEVRPAPALYLDAGWVEDEKLFGSRYSVGARAAIPFDLARLSRGQNPFTGALAGFQKGGAQIPFVTRFTEMVIRDLHVRTDVSKPVEVVADRRILEKTLVAHDRKDYTEILASEVTFVDGNNRSELENGTWENPYRQINAGVKNAVGNMVYVREASLPYDENVLLKDGTTLWGAGTPICGQHGTFQGSRYPVVNGGGNGPAVTLANHVQVTGFELIQPAGSSPSSPVIFGENVSGVTIFNNTIRGNGTATAGISLQASSISSFVATLWNNRIAGVAGPGIDIGVVAVPDVDLTLGKNTVTGNNGDGAILSATACDDFHVYISGNYSGNGGAGMTLLASTGDTVVEGADIMAHANGGDGLFLDIYGYNSVQTSFNHVDVRNNLADGIHAVMASGGSVCAVFADNKLMGNGMDGLFLDLNSGLDSWIVARGNAVTHNGANGVNVQTLAPWDSVYDFGMAADYGLNLLQGNGAYQLLLNGLGTLSAVGDGWGTPTPTANVDYRGEGGGLIMAAPALNTLPTP